MPLVHAPNSLALFSEPKGRFPQDAEVAFASSPFSRDYRRRRAHAGPLAASGDPSDSSVFSQ